MENKNTNEIIHIVVSILVILLYVVIVIPYEFTNYSFNVGEFTGDITHFKIISILPAIIYSIFVIYNIPRLKSLRGINFFLSCIVAIVVVFCSYGVGALMLGSPLVIGGTIAAIVTGVILDSKEKEKEYNMQNYVEQTSENYKKTELNETIIEGQHITVNIFCLMSMVFSVMSSLFIGIFGVLFILMSIIFGIIGICTTKKDKEIGKTLGIIGIVLEIILLLFCHYLYF